MAKKNKPINQKFDVATYPYLDCREQHSWKPFNAVIDQKQKLGFRTLKCANCPTKRYSVISLRVADYGDIISNSYRYPKDYRIEGGLGRRDRSLVRIHNFFAEVEEQS